MNVYCAVFVFITLVYVTGGEQICSVCCWEGDKESIDDSDNTRTCRMCIHDSNTCQNNRDGAEFAGPYQLGADKPGKSFPLEFHASPGRQYGNRHSPGSEELDTSQHEILAGPPAAKSRGNVPGFKAQAIVLPEGPEDVEPYLTYASRPGGHSGPPAAAYGSPPAPAAPGWNAYAPGEKPQELTKTGDKIGAKVKGIAFSASTTKRITARRADAFVTYDKVLSNLDSDATARDNSFNQETGNFTCFVPGHYMFTINIKKIRGHHTFRMNLMKNDNVITKIESSSYSDTISSTSIVHLEKNDKVYLRLRRRYSVESLTSFSGYLIYAD